MAIDTVGKRASSVGCYWPSGVVDRIAGLEEYSGLAVGVAVTLEPVGVPELRRLTMRRGTTTLSTGRTEKLYQNRRGGSTLSIRRR